MNLVELRQLAVEAATAQATVEKDTARAADWDAHHDTRRALFGWKYEDGALTAAGLIELIDLALDARIYPETWVIELPDEEKSAG